MKLTKTEERLLKEISGWRDKYPIHWMQKTRVKLIKKGLVELKDGLVSRTEAGKQYQF